MAALAGGIQSKDDLHAEWYRKGMEESLDDPTWDGFDEIRCIEDCPSGRASRLPSQRPINPDDFLGSRWDPTMS
jgi:hypothetical protein